MAAPSKNWTAILDADINADSPLTETLMTEIRDNLVHLEEWLGDGYTAAKDHDHDGVSSKSVVLGSGVVTQAKMAASAVGQVELKTALGSYYHTGSQQTTLPGGQYGFWPECKVASGTLVAQMANTAIGGTFVATLWTSATGGGSPRCDVQQRYITASPPYKLGGETWGHFLFLLRNPSTGVIKSAWEAPDPPWAYNGAVWLAKDDPGRIAEVAHPFADYWDKDPATDGLEITLVDLRDYDVQTWKADNFKLGKGILEDLAGNINPNREISHDTLSLMAIAGFTDRVKIRERV